MKIPMMYLVEELLLMRYSEYFPVFFTLIFFYLLVLPAAGQLSAHTTAAERYVGVCEYSSAA